MSIDVLGELARVKALFQARTVAAVIGAPPPNPAAFRREAPSPATWESEVNKDRTGKHGSEIA